MLYLIGWIYKFVGKLLLRRKCHISACTKCGRGVDVYFPYRGAFPWEWEYWMSYKPETCCGQTMTVERSFDGNSGALYRLPGYKAYSDADFIRKLRAHILSD